MLYIGIDNGTQSTKTIVLDYESGKILATASEAYGLISGLPPGHMEQDPCLWIQAAGNTIQACLSQIGERRSEVRAIGVSGQQHGLVPLNSKGDPVRNAKLWCDTSTQEQCEKIAEAFGGQGELIERTGNAMLPGYTAPKILWLIENEPANYQSTRSMLLPHDYLNFWLTGEKKMEYGDASGTALLNIRKREWDRELCHFIAPDLLEKLPEVGSSSAPVGLIRSALAKEWGIPETTLVSAGGGDNMMGAIGTGNIQSGIVTASLGTSGTLYSYSTKPVIDPKGEVAAFCDSTDCWLPLACTMNVTVATERVRAMFNWDNAQLEQAVKAAPEGANGLLFLPYLNGERMPNLPAGKGVFYGLTMETMAPEFLARSTTEGVTLGLAYGLKRFEELDVTLREIRLTGGGSKSGAWRQICADIFGYPTVALKTAEGAALGAAIQAAWVEHAVNGPKTPLADMTRRLIELDETTRCQPNPKLRDLYEHALLKQTELMRKLHQSGYI